MQARPQWTQLSSRFRDSTAQQRDVGERASEQQMSVPVPGHSPSSAKWTRNRLVPRGRPLPVCQPSATALRAGLPRLFLRQNGTSRADHRVRGPILRKPCDDTVRGRARARFFNFAEGGGAAASHSRPVFAPARFGGFPSKFLGSPPYPSAMRAPQRRIIVTKSGR
jgi:hypothetical protein